MDGGELFLCGTPIGNLGDITFRALEVLRSVDLIAAEDTRRTQKLLTHYRIAAQLTSYHKFNEKKKAAKLLEMLAAGKNIALVTDAGMPGISDPGEYLVQKAVADNIAVTVIPGPTAVTAALSVSGLPAGSFLFAGFLPRNDKERREKMAAYALEKHTLIFYEAPHRIRGFLRDMREIFGSRRIAVCRELTKQYEEIIRGSVDELLQHFTDNEPRGEFCIVVAGAGEALEEEIPEETIVEELEKMLAEGRSVKDAAKELALYYQRPKREIYNLAVKMNNKEEK